VRKREPALRNALNIGCNFILKLLKLLRLDKKPTGSENYPYENILHLWEDDYLMLELLPFENLEFVKAETNRINNFAQDHFDNSGFTDITPIGDKPTKTIDRLIKIPENRNDYDEVGT